MEIEGIIVIYLRLFMKNQLDEFTKRLSQIVDQI